MSRIIGIDFGSKRIGVAMSSEDRKFAMPLLVVKNSKEVLGEIVKICKENGVKEVVMGESRDFKGKPNKINEEILGFKIRLEAKGLVVILEPEFLTSVAAERFQGKNEQSDASAAALILQSYLDRSSVNLKHSDN